MKTQNLDFLENIMVFFRFFFFFLFFFLIPNVYSLEGFSCYN